MKKETKTTQISDVFVFSAVPTWYVLCTNGACPHRLQCLRYIAGSHAPDSLESATCVLPAALKDGLCRWQDKPTTVVVAYGFTQLYKQVLKQDFTPIRKRITELLHGTKLYYQYMRGERPLYPEQQQAISAIVAAYGYDWEVPFDRLDQAYAYGHAPTQE